MHGTSARGINEFRGRFTFDPNMTGRVGVERECFVVRNGTIVPEAERVLKALEQIDLAKRFGYELSACQVEGHTGPCSIENLEHEIGIGDIILRRALDNLGLDVSYIEVAPETMPLDVFPDPTGRYATITAKMPRHVLLAACRVVGTHVHVGMPDHETALRVYNSVIEHCDELSALGDNSDGKRLSIYREVKKDCEPQPYENWLEFYRHAVDGGYAVDVRSCWSLVRISKFGTIEARMFGATESRPRVSQWARAFHKLCMGALQ